MIGGPTQGAGLAPTTAQDYWNNFDAIPDDKWWGADGSQSVVLPDGRVLWTFADTFRKPSGFDHNTFIVQGLQGDLTVINRPIPNRADGSYIWPIKPIRQGNTVYIFSNRVIKDEAAPMGFRGLGNQIERFDATTLARKSPIELPSKIGVSWTAAVYRGSTYTYIWGNKHNWLGHDGYLARVENGYLHDLTRWRFWTGGSIWSSDETLAKSFSPAGKMDSTWNVLRVPNTSGYRLVTKSNSFLGSTVDLYVSDKITGPWSFKRTLATYPNDSTRTSYMAGIHPWAKLASGKYLMTVCHGDTLSNMLNYPESARPDFKEVDLT